MATALRYASKWSATQKAAVKEGLANLEAEFGKAGKSATIRTTVANEMNIAQGRSDTLKLINGENPEALKKHIIEITRREVDHKSAMRRAEGNPHELARAARARMGQAPNIIQKSKIKMGPACCARKRRNKT